MLATNDISLTSLTGYVGNPESGLLQARRIEQQGHLPTLEGLGNQAYLSIIALSDWWIYRSSRPASHPCSFEVRTYSAPAIA